MQYFKNYLIRSEFDFTHKELIKIVTFLGSFSTFLKDLQVFDLLTKNEAVKMTMFPACMSGIISSTTLRKLSAITVDKRKRETSVQKRVIKSLRRVVSRVISHHNSRPGRSRLARHKSESALPAERTAPFLISP